MTGMTGLQVIPVLGVPEVRRGDDVAELLTRALSGGEALHEGDVLVVSAS